MKTATTIPAITPELAAAVAAFRVAQSYTLSIRPIVTAYQREIVLASNLRYAESGAQITTMKDSWLMDDSQADAFYAALDAAHKAHGFTVAEPGQCPLLVAEYAEILAMKEIVTAAEYITHVSRDQATCTLQFYPLVDKIVQFVDAVARESK